MQSSKTTDILLVGKTGNGKSATANTIVGYKAFKSRASYQSVTTNVQFEYGEFRGRNLKVVDSPGIGDTRLDNQAAVKLVVNAVNFAVAANPAGYHAILLVMRFGTRLTNEDIECIKLLKDIFGNDFIRNHGILVMTHGDNFLKEQEDTGETFETWIRSQGEYTDDLMRECGERVILFDNCARDSEEKARQVQDLLNIIDRLAGSGERYTSTVFEKGKEARDNLLKKSKKPQLKEESLMECGLISQQLARVDIRDPETAKIQLPKLRARTDKLLQDIVNQDGGSGSLQVAITLAKLLKESVDEQMATIEEVLKLKQRTKEIETESAIEKMRLKEEEERQREEERRQLEERKQSVKLEAERIALERAHLEAEDARRKENERRRQEKEKKHELQEAKRQEEHEKQMEEMRKFMKQKEEETQKLAEKIHDDYNNIKDDQSWTWGGVVNALAEPVTDLIKWWWNR